MVSRIGSQFFRNQYRESVDLGTDSSLIRRELNVLKNLSLNVLKNSVIV